MQKWEYKRINSIRYDEAELNAAGLEGWELVSVTVFRNTDRSRTITFFLKRPLVKFGHTSNG